MNMGGVNIKLEGMVQPGMAAHYGRRHREVKSAFKTTAKGHDRPGVGGGKFPEGGRRGDL